MRSAYLPKVKQSRALRLLPPVQPFRLRAKAIWDVIHGPANMLAVFMGLAEAHGQNGHCVFGADAHESGHPHPEHRTRPAQENRGCDPNNISSANRGGQRCHEGVERIDALIVALNTAFPKEIKAEWYFDGR